MPSLLDAIVAKLDRSGVPDSKFPDSKGEFWAHCPFHNDRRPDNFSVSERGFKCLSCEASGSLGALGKHFGIRQRKPRIGCTLEDYANAKSLPPGFLKALYLSDGRMRNQYGYYPVVLIPYKDEQGKTVSVRRRRALKKRNRGDDLRFLWRKGDKVMPYGLWRLEEMRTKGWILLVEGESDSHTAWLHDIPALGIPGANQWKSDWARYLEGLDVYVWHEPDQGGDTFIKSLQHDLPTSKVIIPPTGTKDLSEIHCSGRKVPDVLDELKKTARPISLILPLSKSALCLAEIAPWIQEELGQRNSRETKIKIADTLSGWFLHHNKLLVDLGQDQSKGGRPYLVDDDNALWPLERDAVNTRLTLYEAGLNGTEEVYKFVVEALTMEAYRQGHETYLARWQTYNNDTLYVSCGPCYVVRCKDGLEKVPNGTDGIWFAGDACYPAWEPDEMVNPLGMNAFQPSLMAPTEVGSYTPEVQQQLLTVWLAALLSGLRPLPLLVCVGQKGGGKSMLIKAILRMLMGPASIPTILSDDKRDFWTLVTTAPMVGLDNVDADPPSWFADAIAATATGTTVETRELYTNSTKLSRPVTSALAISTRTATFARPDIAERSLPLISTEFDDEKRKADMDLLDEIDIYRDKLLSWCTITAAGLLADHLYAPAGLPLRFVDFARLAWAYMKQSAEEGQTAHLLRAMRQAQSLTVGEADPLVEAIVTYLSDIGQAGSWKGTPSELVKDLQEAGAELPYFGGGKRIARQLREAKATLALLGIDVKEGPWGNSTAFYLWRKDSQLPMEPDDESDIYENEEDIPF